MVDFIAAEDTRKTRHLISSFGIKQKIISFHDHNEKSIVKKLINKIKDGNTIALVSDAGTPCINDPGYTLVKFAREENIDVLPIPGASSIISALSVSGMPIDSFCYEGYLPAKSEKRKSKLMELIGENRTIIFLVSVHKIKDSVDDLILIFGNNRECFIAREMTKMHEQYVKCDLQELSLKIKNQVIPVKGEFILIIEGSKKKNSSNDLLLAKKIIPELIHTNSSSEIINLISKTTTLKRNEIYKIILEMKN
tara:strand:- start:427 stop:1182 length:756 start_codon:yes stop_codon:yes gene_type:complete